MPTSSYDPTLFAGTAAYYQRYREPYDPAVVDILRRELDLDGAGRLLDVGTGTGNVVVPLAPLFDEAVGLDPDRDMLSEAAAAAREAGVSTVRWVPATAEQLPLSLGRFQYSDLRAVSALDGPAAGGLDGLRHARRRGRRRRREPTHTGARRR